MLPVAINHWEYVGTSSILRDLSFHRKKFLFEDTLLKHLTFTKLTTIFHDVIEKQKTWEMHWTKPAGVTSLEIGCRWQGQESHDSSSTKPDCHMKGACVCRFAKLAPACRLNGAGDTVQLYRGRVWRISKKFTVSYTTIKPFDGRVPDMCCNLLYTSNEW